MNNSDQLPVASSQRPTTPEEAHHFYEWSVSMDKLERVTDYIASQFSMTMPRDEAQANLDARALLLRHRMRLADEFEAWMLQTFYAVN